LLPVHRSKGLGDGLGQNEDQEGQDGGEDGNRSLAEDEGSLGSRAGSANRVSDRVETEDGGEWTVDVVFQLLELLRHVRLGRLDGRHTCRRDAE
jgi:hypothetical protein